MAPEEELDLKGFGKRTPRQRTLAEQDAKAMQAELADKPVGAFMRSPRSRLWYIRERDGSVSPFQLSEEERKVVRDVIVHATAERTLGKKRIVLNTERGRFTVLLDGAVTFAPKKVPFRRTRRFIRNLAAKARNARRTVQRWRRNRKASHR